MYFWCSMSKTEFPFILPGKIETTIRICALWRNTGAYNSQLLDQPRGNFCETHWRNFKSEMVYNIKWILATPEAYPGFAVTIFGLVKKHISTGYSLKTTETVKSYLSAQTQEGKNGIIWLKKRRSTLQQKYPILPSQTESWPARNIYI